MRVRLLLVAPALLAGCITAPLVESTPLGAPQPARPDSADVQLFSVRTPECPFQEIGLVSARRPPGSAIDMDEVRKALVQRAREMGGDAVAGLAQTSSGRAEAAELHGTIIRFTDSGCRH